MAIIGGAGNPVGGSFTGPAEALEIIGDRCMAYSGRITSSAASGAEETMLTFTTGNYYSDIKLGFIEENKGAETVYFSVFMNGIEIIKNQYDGAPDNDLISPMYLIIPAYTELEVKWGVASVTKDGCAWISGQIFRD